MLKKRIVASLVVKNGVVVQSFGFVKYLPVGSVAVAAEFLNKWGIDEIVILDIDATRQKKEPDFNMVSKIAERIFVPLTVGGGIRSLDDIRKLIHWGADKIAINKTALQDHGFIKKAARVFGAQCVVVSMDVKINGQGRYEVFSDSGSVATGLDPVKWAKQVEGLGAGEILLTSIERDGSKKGYDLDLAGKVAAAVRIPVIACGGAGRPSHFMEAFAKGNASAAAAGNFFHFTEHSPVIAKAYLRKMGIDVRLDTFVDYKDIGFDKRLERILKRPDSYLEKIRFEYQPEEII